ncbi:MAG: hypothetical protein ACKVWR_18615, partial [Acidimicrobiales bacterium]
HLWLGLGQLVAAYNASAPGRCLAPIVVEIDAADAVSGHDAHLQELELAFSRVVRLRAGPRPAAAGGPGWSLPDGAARELHAALDSPANRAALGQLASWTSGEGLRCAPAPAPAAGA